MRRQRVVHSAMLLAMSASLLFFSSCSRTSSSAISPGKVEAGDSAVPGGSGVESRTWVSQADGPVLDAALRGYGAGDEQVSTEASRVWAANGLRIFVVPMEKLAEVETALRTGAGSASTQKLGLAADAQWTEIVRGPSRDSDETIALETERVRIGPGALRLLARCWTVPLPPRVWGAGAAGEAEGPSAAVQIEIVPQHVETRKSSGDETDQLTRRATTIDPGAAGQVFDRLLLGLTARGGAAYVIVPERPGVDWSAAPAGEGEQGAGQAKAESAARPTPKVGQVVRGRAAPGAVDAFDPAVVMGTPASVEHAGPRSVNAPALGEAMLMSDVSGGAERSGSRAASRVMLVLVPRVPRQFNLTGQ